MQKKQLKAQIFWKKIRFKYKLSILNENTLGEIFSLRVSKLSASLIIFIFSLLLIVLTSVIIISTPVRNYLPGYLDVEVRNDIMSLALKADSLQNALNVQNLYTHNVALILKGEMPVDSIRRIDSLQQFKPDSVEFKKSDDAEKFVKKYEDESRYKLSALPRTTSSEYIFFYPPVIGKISSPFDKKEKHFGIDIAADPKESVLATLDGTVIFTAFDSNSGYVIQLQHTNGYTSIYKHNTMLLKREGDIVRAGEAIAIVGNTGNLSTGTHLHFELWDKGMPLNPEDYIIFNR
ncbi:MAG: M23 family metallopeptidase [Dysgonamonadaceae bacterium]|jgi:murein DD-endopeptidase MepM/ murein hydrolase activator NlpD|nr:M23 family metallopeptidase [Dysgonamonadaceae bacterium]